MEINFSATEIVGNSFKIQIQNVYGQKHCYSNNVFRISKCWGRTFFTGYLRIKLTGKPLLLLTESVIMCGVREYHFHRMMVECSKEQKSKIKTKEKQSCKWIQLEFVLCFSFRYLKLRQTFKMTPIHIKFNFFKFHKFGHRQTFAITFCLCPV